MPDLVLERGEDLLLPLQEARPAQVPPGDGVVRDKRAVDVQMLDEELRFSIRHYCYGSVGTTREWLLNDNITPAETAVKMMFASMPENMRRIFFDS